jgi:hypothetical protein
MMMSLTITEKTIDGKVWYYDERNNRASLDRWGGKEIAVEKLESLVGCSGCSDCSDCSDCYDCSDCSGCSGCYDCSRCSDCSGCYDCSDCSGCYGCYDCSDCSGCYGCYDCSGEKRNEIPEAPAIENIHSKMFEAVSKPGSLDMSDWHTCETTHCRAGWVVHLAGKAGYELEQKTSPEFAAMQIYKASGYQISPCRFFDSEADAMADMKRLAELEMIPGRGNF